ncbi:protein SPT2 homolog isoform X2 [Odontomachus brunneus]|uniref:protein SPT2 homolog isoform X2 n=1 Tax=Odontomachus brunneus TaxID=486640 RepID=UPI0013F24118|nr:protein SPT2 homolog isoform X2 [Odontomachus brunneus]
MANGAASETVLRNLLYEIRRMRYIARSRGSSCCGSRHSSSGFARPDHNYNKIPVETGRYPSQYGERHPIDRFGWQTQSRPSSSTASGGGRPSGGGGSYSGNGVYAGSQSGDRYGSRPAYGSESTNRPGASGYGSGNSGGFGVSTWGFSRPTGYGGPVGGGGGGGYGISGTLADGDEFGPGDPVFSDGNASQHPGNVQAQKAVALKALAGVALIGAAAALASNPVLLPIGIVAGRKKRSESFSEEVQPEVQTDYIIHMLRENLAKIQKDGSSNRLIVSPRCVARLTCEIQKDYLSDLGKDFEIVNTQRKQYLTNLIRNNVLNTASVSVNVKNLIKLAVGVATEDKNCDVFSCSYIRKG